MPYHFPKNRLDDYITIVQETPTTSTTVTTLASTITEAANNILETRPNPDIIDEIYEVLNDVQSVLLCYMECGAEPIEIAVF